MKSPSQWSSLLQLSIWTIMKGFSHKGGVWNLFWKVGVLFRKPSSSCYFWLPLPVFRLQVISYTTILKLQFTNSKKSIMIPKTVKKACYTNGMFRQQTGFSKQETNCHGNPFSKWSFPACFPWTSILKIKTPAGTFPCEDCYIRVFYVIIFR